MKKVFAFVAMFLILVMPMAVAKVQMSTDNSFKKLDKNKYNRAGEDYILNDVVSLMDDPFLKDFLPKGATSYADYYTYGGKYATSNLAKVTGEEIGDTDVNQYMIGSVSVIVVLPESIDGSENWTDEEIANVHNMIIEGANWWTDREPNANLEFNFTFYDRVEIPEEPIENPGISWWIPHSIDALGYIYIPGENNYYDPMHDLINDKRIEQGTDWGFIVFVADSTNDDDGGKFADNYSAFSTYNLDGDNPYLVMTYDNNYFGIENMNNIFAHEMGHIFGAKDEYAQSGCQCNYDGGYLNYVNENCANECLLDEPSIMKYQGLAYEDGLVDIYARGQIGWTDDNENGVLDIVDFEPVVNNYFAGLVGEEFEINGSANSGIVSAINPSYRDSTVNSIEEVEFRVNDNSWITASAIDGAFDDFFEEYVSVYEGISEWGDYVFNVRATDRFDQVTNESNYAEVTYQSMGCEDTDVEDNSKVQGNVINYNGEYGNESDSCILIGSAKYVQQFSCDGNNIISTNTRCFYGCNEGRCLNKPSPRTKYQMTQAIDINELR
ncbi:hypothetical protein HOD88_03655 [archaeon]|nr:hypothetical protein [archaeon]